MQALTAVVLGATGFIGEQLVQQLLNDPAFSKVRILVRRPVQLSHPKLEVAVVKFDDLGEFKSELGTGEVIFCCIGTTQKQVKGNKIEYRKIDVDIPVHAARLGLEAGFTKYLLVSAVGANALSKNFYLSLKGEVEDTIKKLNYSAFHVFRPSILLGIRKEFRLAEVIGKGVMQALSILFIGGLKKYKGIQGSDVAKAMVQTAKSNERGTKIYHYDEMMQIIVD
jgi:uncharacterized protein YbjT (DUF2867 family)